MSISLLKLMAWVSQRWANQPTNYKLNFISAASCGQGSRSSANTETAFPDSMYLGQEVNMYVSPGQRAQCHFNV